MRLFLLLGVIGCREQEKLELTEEQSIVVDADGDGYFADEDCDDLDAESNPGANEICDGIDNNCDGQADEAVTTVFYADSDGDGFGNPVIETEACEAPDGYVTNGSDCDDTEATAYPSSTEVCDGIDNDCDDEIDEDMDMPFYVDGDGDGFGDDENIVYGCDAQLGLTTIGGDCDDADPSISPIANEICDEIDNNCNDTIDEGVTTSFFIDFDEDGYGSGNTAIQACVAPSGYVENDLDCDDLDSQVNPDATEACDTVDNDCDGDVDEEGSVGSSVWYEDGDEDGYGDSTNTTLSCSQPNGYVADNTDCDDNNNLFHPGMPESCNGYDDDCDGQTDEGDATDATVWYADADSDGFGDANSTTNSCDQPSGFTLDSTDCDDTDSDVNPAASEVCNGEDDNCDGQVDGSDSVDSSLSYLDTDGDGFGDDNNVNDGCNTPNGYVLYSGDCDDTNSNANPNAIEICDDIDNNCDGTVDEDTAIDVTTWYLDADGDGYGISMSTEESCDQPLGYANNSDDCNDTESSISPAGSEICDGLDNDCDGDTDDNASDAPTWYIDHDGDGYGSTDYTILSCDQPSGYLATGGDCDDMSFYTNPGVTELCDEIDNDCDGDIDEDGTVQVWYLDSDGDGFGDAGVFTTDCSQPNGYVANDTDCDDGDVNSYPNAPELCDGLDNNCDGSVNELGFQSCPAVSCAEIIDSEPTAISGVYYLDPDSSGTVSENYCDMDIDGGGWTLILKAYNGDETRFYNSQSHYTFEDSSTINDGNPGLDLEDYKSQVYTSLQGEQLMAMDLNQATHYAYGDINNGNQTIVEHLLDAQDGRWEGGINGCGNILDNYYASIGTSTTIGGIPITQIGLMCVDDQNSGGWNNRSDDSVYFGFYPYSSCGDNQPWHHSGIGKWANDGGDDVYDGPNSVCSYSSGIAIFLR